MLTNIVCVWFIVFLWWQSRNRFTGTAFWVIDFTFQAVALILILLRDAIPEWMSMVLASALIIAGMILALLGLERFLGEKGPQIHNILLLILFIFIHGYFTLVQPNVALRNLNVSGAMFLVCLQCVWLMWRRVEAGLRSLTFGVGLVFFLLCLVSAIRIGAFFVSPDTRNSFFQPYYFESLVIVSYQMLLILLAYSLFLMVNRRLLLQMGTQEEKFAKAFQSAPYAITLTRTHDGRIVEANEAFFSISGYDRAEILGKSAIDLHLWERDEDRVTVVDTLSKGGSVYMNEMSFRRKNGESVTGLFSADIITIEGEKSILSSIADITDRKRAEEKIKASLWEKEILLSEIHHRVKNNLQVISGLLDIQARASGKPEVIEMCHESQRRIRSMAMVHEKLYGSKDFTRTDMAGYVGTLSQELFQSYNVNSRKIEMIVQSDGVYIDINKGIPCGLILNELISNAFKHAFPGDRQGKLQIIIRMTENAEIEIVVRDNGVGMPDDFDIHKPLTVGLYLVNGLVKNQLDGQMEVKRDSGTEFRITFPL
jgi:PAS domain S-box-containing protein